MVKAVEFIDGIKTRYLVLVLGGIYIVSRVIYYLFGVRFDDMNFCFHAYLDFELLRSKLLESLFYLHIQPPLFNLFLGLIIKAFPDSYGYAFSAIYLIIGFTLYVLIVLLQVKLGVSRILAILIATLFTVSPSAILFENWLFYTLPLTAILVLSIFAFSSYVKTGKTTPLIVFFTSISVICGIRSLYHIVYFIIIIAFILIIRKYDWKRILAAASLPFVFIAALYIKNFLLFGILTTSSWFGMNFSAMTVMNLPVEEREALAVSGELSDVAPVTRFSALPEYPSHYTEDKRYSEIETLHQPLRSNGHKNFNHIGYIEISRAYLHDSLYVLRKYPGLYAAAVAKAWHIYSRPATDLGLLNRSGNLDEISGVVTFYNYLFAGKIPFDLRNIENLGDISISPVFIYAFSLIILPFLVLFGFAVGFNYKPLKKLNIRGESKLTILLICYNIVFVALIANSLDYSENMRFRFTTDPLSLILLGVFLQFIVVPRVKSTAAKVFPKKERDGEIVYTARK